MKNLRQTLSIIVADDHPVVLHGMTALLQSRADFCVVAACGDGAAALEAIRTLKPDVAVLDLAMPNLNGLEVLSTVAAERSRTKVVYLAATASDAQIVSAIARGAKGIMLKHMAPDELVKCVREVGSGGNWFPADMVDAALERESGRQVQTDLLQQNLTPREREVMLLVSEGLPNKLVAQRLSVSEGTVKIHLHNIYYKTGAANRTALTAIAITRRDQLRSR